MGDLSVFPPSPYRHTPLLGENENLIPFERFGYAKLNKVHLPLTREVSAKQMEGKIHLPLCFQ